MKILYSSVQLVQNFFHVRIAISTMYCTCLVFQIRNNGVVEADETNGDKASPIFTCTKCSKILKDQYVATDHKK